MFNSIRYSKGLQNAGFTQSQAETTIEVFYKFMEYNFANKDDLFNIKEDVAFLKQDIILLKQDFNVLRQDFVEFKAEVRADIKTLEYRMTIKMGLMMSAAVGVLALIIKLG